MITALVAISENLALKKQTESRLQTVFSLVYATIKPA